MRHVAKNENRVLLNFMKLAGCSSPLRLLQMTWARAGRESMPVIAFGEPIAPTLNR
jgi:hypothetical protein